MSLHDLPLLNALLNGATVICLLVGRYSIRRRQMHRHRTWMLAAFVCSSLFLTSYLIYHARVGSVPFTGPGAARVVYFTVLISHTILAATIPPLAVITLSRALRARFDRHRSIARWTLPLWLYVSVTGVVIYVMLYRLFPSA